MESGIQLRESRIRQRLKSGIQVPLTENPESMDWNPESKTVLDSLTWCDSERSLYSAALMTSCQWPAWQITLRMILHAWRWFMIQAAGFRIRGAFSPKKWLRFTAVRPMRKNQLEVEVQQIMTRWSSLSRQPGAEISQWDKNQTWSSEWLKISLLQTEFGFRNRGYSCSWNPESSNSFFCGIRNTA